MDGSRRRAFPPSSPCTRGTTIEYTINIILIAGWPGIASWISQLATQFVKKQSLPPHMIDPCIAAASIPVFAPDLSLNLRLFLYVKSCLRP
ncbi:hypothetical protein BS47DRAFT_1335417 [Hydnum rufescens UP504]|uniref:Uncharacterized protein n=1 Tax=Hydnum rufescens UP504 TaxID=1448309 RepID=A0A9P6BB34_9AGAM|nr:hypothetical protein BS47DRAFT_1335417 [Hydnum rufescens UP504]